MFWYKVVHRRLFWHNVLAAENTILAPGTIITITEIWESTVVTSPLRWLIQKFTHLKSGA